MYIWNCISHTLSKYILTHISLNELQQHNLSKIVLLKLITYYSRNATNNLYHFTLHYMNMKRELIVQGLCKGHDVIEQSLGGDHWPQFNRTSVSQPRSDFDHLVGYIYNLHICMDAYRVRLLGRISSAFIAIQ